MKNLLDELYDCDLFHLTEIADVDDAYKIIEYLDELELKVGEAITHQVERWKKSDSCYQKAVLSGDTKKMHGLENCFIGMAREVIFECMVYI